MCSFYLVFLNLHIVLSLSGDNTDGSGLGSGGGLCQESLNLLFFLFSQPRGVSDFFSCESFKYLYLLLSLTELIILIGSEQYSVGKCLKANNESKRVNSWLVTLHPLSLSLASDQADLRGRADIRGRSCSTPVFRSEG
jgi:hypothetical protein